MPMTHEPLDRDAAERYYRAFCERFHLDPEEQQSAREFEDWFNTMYPERTET